MKILFFYTSHRQLKEIAYTAAFLNSHMDKIVYDDKPFGKICDFIFHCNNKYIDINAFKHNIELINGNVNLIWTTKNCGKTYGAIEALQDNYNLFSGYSYVVHLHPDVFIVDPKPLFDLITTDNLKLNYANVFVQPMGKNKYCFDFFVFRPKANNYLINRDSNSWYDISTPEGCLYSSVQWLYAIEKDFNFKLMDRCDDPVGYMGIDKMGLWHEHNLSYVENYLKNNSIPYDDTPQVISKIDNSGMINYSYG